MFAPLAVSYANAELPVSPGDALHMRARHVTVHLRDSKSVECEKLTKKNRVWVKLFQSSQNFFSLQDLLTLKIQHTRPLTGSRCLQGRHHNDPLRWRQPGPSQSLPSAVQYMAHDGVPLIKHSATELMLWLRGGCGSWQAATGLQQEQSKACHGSAVWELEGGANN